MNKSTKKAAKKSAKQVKAKSRTVYVPANAKVFVLREGEPYPPDFRELVDKIVHNELQVAAEKGKEASMMAAAPSQQQVLEKVMGLVLSVPTHQQNSIMAQALFYIKNERQSNLYSLEHQYDHITEKRQQAQQNLYDLENIMNGNVTIVNR